MSYGHVYVASICQGASQAQAIKALIEAEAYPGPSLVIAYSPCIAWGIKGGLANSNVQSKLAVESGYWTTFRFNPLLANEGKNPFVLDSKEPNYDKYHEYLMGETRYAQLTRINPEMAEELLQANLAESRRRNNMYKRYALMDYSNEGQVDA